MGRGGWGRRSAGVLDWCERVAEVLEFLACPSQFVVGVFEGAQGGAFRRCWGVGLQLVDKQFDEGSVERSGMGSFVGNVCALLCVESLRDAVKVKAVLTELLEKKGLRRPTPLCFWLQ